MLYQYATYLDVVMIMLMNGLHLLVDLAYDISSLNYAKLRWLFVIWFSWHKMCYKKEIKMISKMVNYSSRDSPYESDEQHGVGNSSDREDTLRSLKA